MFQSKHRQAACLGTTRAFSSPTEDRLKSAQIGDILHTRPETILELERPQRQQRRENQKGQIWKTVNRRQKGKVKTTLQMLGRACRHQRHHVPGTDGACGLEPQQSGGRMVGPARGKRGRRQAFPSKSSFHKEREPLEGQRQAGKQPRPARGADTKKEGLVTLPAPGPVPAVSLSCVVPLLAGRCAL